MQTHSSCYGVDVSAHWLDIADEAGNVVRIENDLRAIEDWLASIEPDSAISMEVSGAYYRLLAITAYKAGIDVYVLNPRLLSHYARGIGRKGKSDKIDALIIQRYLAHEQAHLSRWSPPTDTQTLIDNLFSRRSQLIKQRQALSMGCKQLHGISQKLTPALDALDALINELEQLVLQQIKRDETLYVSFNTLRSIPGVGPLTAAYMVNTLSRLHFRSSDKLVSFMGMDLSFSDSGKKVSRRRLSKHGPSEARRLLFNCARSASMGAFKPLYDNFRNRMNHTQATVAMMRKLLKIILGVWKSKQSFELAKYGSPYLT